MMSLGNAESGMEKEKTESYMLEYSKLNLTLIYKITYYWCVECEEYHTSEILTICVNDLIYSINLSNYLFFEEVRAELRRLYKQLRSLFPKHIANSILGTIGNMLYLICKKSYIPKSAKKIVL